MITTTIFSSFQNTSNKYLIPIVSLCFGLFFLEANAQFIHPGISHKKSDLDRMKYMVEAQIDPYYTSYQNMVDDSKSSFNYNVQGDESFTVLGRDDGTNYGEWNSDIRAAYYNAIRWYISGDSRHAEKAIEIFSAWSNLTSVTSGGTEALSGGVGYIMIEAAEIIKSTYDGWATNDLQAFEDMLVYPGYSNTSTPNNIRGNTTFYWSAYQGDPVRHGNQGLSGWRTVMAMGIFLDNEIMYDRALRYIQGLPHRSDDLAYPSGPNTSTELTNSGEHNDTYSISRGNSIEDYGYNEVMTHYIWETGQCQESSRDQAHVLFGLGLLNSMAEMAWNQGDNLYAHEDDRLLLGLEYSLKYNVSYLESFPDQPQPWEPATFIQQFDRTGRWYSKSISPEGIGGFTNYRPNWEMSVGHYIGRGFKTEEEALWTQRARDVSINRVGYERAGWTNDAIGWGGLTFRRPAGCYGDPVTGFSNAVPEYNMHVIPKTIEAENFDYSHTTAEGRVYHDTSNGNNGDAYRNTEDVDIEICSEGGFNITSIENEEWLTYTVAVPETGTYNLAIRYAATSANGSIQFSFGGEDKTGMVALPATGGAQSWETLSLGQGILLSQGVQSIKINFGGVANTISLNNFSITESSDCVAASSYSVNELQAGIAYRYYEGTWNTLPDFDDLEVLDAGIATSIGLDHGERADNFGYAFEGYINITTEGDYTFYTNSDDGSNLYINGVKVVDNDGTHGEEEVSGAICLQEGLHKLEVDYFDLGGTNDVLEVSYAGPQIAKTEIENLYHLDGDTLTINELGDIGALFSIYPNPIHDTLSIDLGEGQKASVEVYNMLGQVEMALPMENSQTLNLENISAGVYILKISVGNKFVTRTIIKK